MNNLYLLKELHAIAVDAMGAIQDIRGKNNVDIFLSACLGRLVNLLDAIIVLVSAGLIYEAQIIARTLFELTCQVLVVDKDPSFLDKIKDHELCAYKLSLERTLGKKVKTAAITLNPEARAYFQTELERITQQIKKSDAKSIGKEDLASRAGLQTFYVTFYEQFCDPTHVSLKHLNECVMCDGQNTPQGIFYGRNHHPDEGDPIIRLSESLTNAFLTRLAKRFKLKIIPAIEQISDALSKIPVPFV